MSSATQHLAELQKEANTLKGYLSDNDTTSNNEEVDRKDEEAFVKNFENCVIVDNLPKVPEAKIQKLQNVMKKIFSQVGTIVDIEMPFDSEKSTTCGFAFVELESASQSAKAVSSVNNYQLDKRHKLLVNRYEDMEKYLNTPDTYVEPEKEPFQAKPDLKSWLADTRGRDMFTLRYGGETEIHWIENGRTAMHYDGEHEKQGGKQWCSQYVMWSPQGTYLATFHPQGIALWGGDEFKKLGRFAHKSVKIALFSPQENYLITCSEIESDAGIIVWDVRTQKMLRAFPSTGGANGVEGVITPFRWSHDDKYVARRGKDVISIFETPSMKLLEKKSLKADGVLSFQWSPTDNTLTYHAPESANSPARVSLVQIPSRQELRRKNLFNVSSCKVYWQSGGNFLCVKVIRHSKSKKTLYTNLELFRTREQLIPVEMLEMKETVVAFAWEPKGTRFAIAHGEGTQRLSVSFYDMCGGNKGDEVTLLYTLKDKACNQIIWSPQGNYAILAGLGEMNGSLEFWNADEQQSLAQQEHFKCTSIEWDPSGRVVSTAVCQSIDNSYYKYQMDNGYKVWSFQGKNLQEQNKDVFYQFLWRPRPKSLLSDKEFKEVVRNIKKYEKKYHELDRKKEKERLEKEEAAKLESQNAFKELLKARKAAFRARRSELISLRDGYDSEDDELFIIETKTSEKIVSTKEDVM